MTRFDLSLRFRRQLRRASDFAGNRVYRRISTSVASYFYHAAIIFVYHRIARVSSDPHDLAVSPERFEEQLVALRKWGRPLRLRDLSQQLVAGHLPPRGYVVTFDDGYADNLLYAKPLLEKYETPATVFTSSDYAPGGRAFWWDVVAKLRAAAVSKGIELHLGAKKLDDSGAFQKRLAKSPRKEVDAAIAELVAQVGAEVYTEPEGRPMSAVQLHELSASGLVDIGSHTVTHRRLADLPENEQREEIFGAKRDLERVLGRSVDTFAYPFGAAGSDFSEATQRLVREAGYSCACAVRPYSVGLGVDRFALPRCWVSDWSGDELSRRLRFWYTR